MFAINCNIIINIVASEIAFLYPSGPGANAGVLSKGGFVASLVGETFM